MGPSARRARFPPLRYHDLGPAHFNPSGVMKGLGPGCYRDLKGAGTSFRRKIRQRGGAQESLPRVGRGPL